MRYHSAGIVVFFIDRFLKYIVTTTDGFFIFGGLAGFVFSKNSGIALSLPLPPIVSIPLTVALLIFIVPHWRYQRATIPFFLVVYGGVSNLIDRILYGYVTDYATIRLFAHEFSFNLADAMIVSGVLWFLRSPRHREKKDIGALNTATYNAIAREFSASRKKPLWEEVAQFKRYVKDGARILDAGCGDGRLLPLFGDMRIDYVGIDASSELLLQARKRITNHARQRRVPLWGKSRITGTAVFQEGDMRLLDFPNHSFDYVFMIASLHHMPPNDQTKAIREAYRVLKPDGMLFVTVLNMLRLSLRDKTVWRYLHYPLVRTMWNGHPLYYYAFTLQKIKKLCTRARFHIYDAFYSIGNKRVHWWRGRNLVVFAKK